LLEESKLHIGAKGSTTRPQVYGGGRAQPQLAPSAGNGVTSSTSTHSAQSRSRTSVMSAVDTIERDSSLLMSGSGVLGKQQAAIAALASSYFDSREGQQAFLADFGACLRHDDDAQRVLAAAHAHSTGASEAARREEAPLRPYELAGATLTELDTRLLEEQAKAESKYEVSVLNPLAAVLLPVQEALHDSAVLPLRRLTDLLSWEDPYNTSLLALNVCALMLLCALVPWGLLFHVLARVLGLALLGPHMAWVGEKLYQSAQRDRDAERAYSEMDEAERKTLLQRYRESLLEQHGDAMIADAAEKPHAERRALLARSKHVKGKLRLLVPSELSTARIHATLPQDPCRSSAHYRPELHVGRPQLRLNDPDEDEDDAWIRSSDTASTIAAKAAGYEELRV